MPKKHSTMSLYKPTYNTTLTSGSLQSFSMTQKSGPYNDIKLYYHNYVKPYYISKFQSDYFEQIELMDFDDEHGAEIETKFRNWKISTSSDDQDVDFVKVLTDLALDMVLNVRHAFTILRTNNALATQIAEMQTVIEQQDQIIQSGSHLNNKRFQASLLCNVEGNVSLDLRYWLYIKEHGSPLDGAFDLEKLSKYIYVDASGNPLSDQDYLQYTAFGLVNTNVDNQQFPTIFTEPVLTDPQAFEEIINVDVSDNPLTPW